MKTTRVVVPWTEGWQLRAAAGLVRRTQGFASRIVLKTSAAVGDTASILSLVILCAGMGMTLVVEATGPDEEDAVALVERYFAAASPDSDTSADPPES